MEPYKKYLESIRICAKTLHIDESGIGIIESLVNHVIKETLNEATEDKKAPVEEDETAESVLLRRGVHYTIPNEIKTVTVKSALQAMREYASQERNRAIQEGLNKIQAIRDNIYKKGENELYGYCNEKIKELKKDS